MRLARVGLAVALGAAACSSDDSSVPTAFGGGAAPVTTARMGQATTTVAGTSTPWAASDASPSKEVQPITTTARDGELDCNTGRTWISGGDIDLDTPGEPTAEVALRLYLEQWRELFGAEITMVAEDRAAFIVDGAEVVVASTTRTNAGGFAVTDAAGCDGYEPELLLGPPSPEQPTPLTAPPVTT